MNIYELKPGQRFTLPEGYSVDVGSPSPVFVFEKMDGMYGHAYWEEEPDVPLFWSGPVILLTSED
jgi:uncharacterized protein YcsI (UPF0317 family)